MKSAAAWLLPGEERGVLPAMLVVLTVVTGIVDSVSFLGLGNVFVANMTGNVVFVGFALAGVTEPSLWASPLAIASFALGAWATGRVARGVSFTVFTLVHLGLLVAAVLVLAGPGADAVVIVLLALGMGIQNASVRHTGIPDMTTTVLTTTLTGLVADSPGTAVRRRVVSIAAMFTGALIGGFLHLHAGDAAALTVAAVLLAAVSAVLVRLSG
ncbi:YoaK family protein [Nonomuraea endophytica]|uniref:Uncharacterized membrane protein YoaK (UPF0700 family) n=1 Tax=Nonomuraea endophytica TaxID=714136 RepID=A0A7W7ZY37_9ACTN|nr:YoaK family protein [Nonomuraea endophytica]MBB5075975.1 uncharacterized membrane protein YoaK (UPF0700 family) [Nonomuraea endophytica]